jgi:hypothetical protein
MPRRPAVSLDCSKKTKYFYIKQLELQPEKVGIREKICYLPRKKFFPSEGIIFSINSSKTRLIREDFRYLKYIYKT